MNQTQIYSQFRLVCKMLPLLVKRERFRLVTKSKPENHGN